MSVPAVRQHKRDEAYTPHGRTPRIVCVECGRGPLDGVALYRTDDELRCEEHKITLADRCPKCSSELLDAVGGGVKCSKCSYWFCF